MLNFYQINNIVLAKLKHGFENGKTYSLGVSVENVTAPVTDVNEKPNLYRHSEKGSDDGATEDHQKHLDNAVAFFFGNPRSCPRSLPIF
jgi:hypothetical protein